MISPLELRATCNGHEHAMALEGELDMATAPRLIDAIEAACARGATAISLDLGDLNFIDSTGLRAVLQARDHCAAHSCRFFLVQPLSEPVGRIFEIAGIDISVLEAPKPAADDSDLTRA